MKWREKIYLAFGRLSQIQNLLMAVPPIILKRFHTQIEAMDWIEKQEAKKHNPKRKIVWP